MKGEKQMKFENKSLQWQNDVRSVMGFDPNRLGNGVIDQLNKLILTAFGGGRTKEGFLSW